MRFLLTIISLMSINLYAAEMPKYLEGATVTVTLKNGKKHIFSSEDMAVVKRENINVNAAKVAGFDFLHEKLVNREIVKNKKNRIYGLAGIGPTGGLKTSTDGKRYKTSQKEGSVIGLGFQRKVDEDVSVGIQVQTNETTSLSLGFDF